MKRHSVQKAYENIRPDEQAKQRMLENILSSASERPPAGKDDTMKHRKMKPALIAAIIALMILSMGCAIVALNLGDMKIGEFTWEDGNRDVISLQGYGNSPSFLASKEWFEFEQSYEVDWSEARDQFEQERSDVYDAYGAYTQEMVDKLNEIAEKYGLKLAGEEATAQSYQTDILFKVLGIGGLHHEAAGVEVEYLSGYFYECGNFDVEYFVTLTDDEAQWPHRILANMRYNGKEYLDTVCFTMDDIDSAEQWNYTTADGTDILIVMGKDFARFFCDREDAFVSVSFGTDYEDDSGVVEYMSKRDVELVADAMDFTVTPLKPDMDAAKQKLEESEAERLASQESREEYGYREFIAERIEALENPEELYYTLIDIDGNGVVDLLLGSKEQCDVVWTFAHDEQAGEDHMNLVTLTEEEWQMLDEAWPNMEIYPITTYPMED